MAVKVVIIFCVRWRLFGTNIFVVQSIIEVDCFEFILLQLLMFSYIVILITVVIIQATWKLKAWVVLTRGLMCLSMLTRVPGHTGHPTRVTWR